MHGLKRLLCGGLLLLGLWRPVAAAEVPLITTAFRDTPIAEAYEMLSRLGRVNILLGKGVNGGVTANLYEVLPAEAVAMIADAAGFAVERRGKSYLILEHEEFGRDVVTAHTEVRSFKVQYADAELVAGVLENYLSRYGEITSLPERKLLVVSDRPDFLQRIEVLLQRIDVQPRQILIEAKILEVILRDDETFGVDWVGKGGNGQLGTGGFSNIGSTGLFLNYLTDDLDLFLKALSENGRVRTLSTPKLLVLEDQDAEVVVGDRIGYKVTTTVNQVTTESIEFLDSGVILKVRAAVDNSGQIMLEVHPEVSTGTVSAGIPSLTTTEVTTQMIAGDGQTIFIGGLIKRSHSEKLTAIPGLGRLPVVGGLFSRTEDSTLTTETVVLITPYLVQPGEDGPLRQPTQRLEELSRDLPKLEVSVPEPSLPDPPRDEHRLWLDDPETRAAVETRENDNGQSVMLRPLQLLALLSQ